MDDWVLQWVILIMIAVMGLVALGEVAFLVYILIWQ